MLCTPGLFPRNLDKRTPPVIDLEKVIHKAAWKALKIPSLCGCKHRPCKQKGLYLKVDWNYLEQHDVVEDFQLVPGEVSIRPVQLYRTQFRNFSGGEQVFTFNAERQTVSTIEMTVQEGISVGGNVNLNFALPTPSVPGPCGAEEKFSLTSALGAQVTWNKNVTDRYSKSETLKWNVNSAVNLQAGQRALASLSILEAKMKGNIILRTDVSILSESGLVPVDVLTKKGDEVIATVDLAANSICKGNEAFTVGKDKRSFSYNTTVICKAVYGIEQIATVRLLQPGEEEQDGDIYEGPMVHRTAARTNMPPLSIEELPHAPNGSKTEAIPLMPVARA